MENAVQLELEGPVTQVSVLDALEERYPVGSCMFNSVEAAALRPLL